MVSLKKSSTVSACEVQQEVKFRAILLKSQHQRGGKRRIENPSSYVVPARLGYIGTLDSQNSSQHRQTKHPGGQPFILVCVSMCLPHTWVP